MKILLVMASLFDCQALSNFLDEKLTHPNIQIDTTTDFASAIDFCKNNSNETLIIDPKAEGTNIRALIEMTVYGHLKTTIVFDHQPRDGILLEILPYRSISYLTRQMTSDQLAFAIHGILVRRERAFDPRFDNHIELVNNVWRLRDELSNSGIFRLTEREKTIFRLLAEGFAVKDIATQLNVSQSAVDNHKIRLMKKLGANKVTQLVHLAIRHGFIHVA